MDWDGNTRSRDSLECVCVKEDVIGGGALFAFLSGLNGDLRESHLCRHVAPFALLKGRRLFCHSSESFDWMG